VLLLGAAALDLTQRATQPHPFVATAIERGNAITPEALRWREIPAGLLSAPSLQSAVAARRLEPGEPLLPSSLGTTSDVPADWWSVPMALPDGIGLGTAVRVVTLDPPLTVDGIVVSISAGGAFSTGTTGLVAVPAAASSLVAAAAIEGTATVLFSP